MDAEEYARRSVQALNAHARELDAMSNAVIAAAKNRTEIPNAKEIFKEMAEASGECKSTLEYYGDDEMLPSEVRLAMERVQQELSNCSSAFVLYMAIARLTL
jgi:hypothetical protein